MVYSKRSSHFIFFCGRYKYQARSTLKIREIKHNTGEKKRWRAGHSMHSGIQKCNFLWPEISVINNDGKNLTSPSAKNDVFQLF